MSDQSIPIQTALMPAYYKKFHCIMGACQDNCCDDGWKIEFSKKDYLKVKRASKSQEMEMLMIKGMRRLREKEHDDKYAEFCVTETGRCAFHTEEGLCRLQLECGEETLPQVCREFPRQELITTAAKEYSLSPACEGVLALLWDLPEGVDFWEESLPSQECVMGKPRSRIEARFADIRSFCIDVLQERSRPLPQRILLLGLLLQRLVKMDWDDEKTVDRWLIQGEHLLRSPEAALALDKLPQNRQAFLSHNFRVLEVLLAEGNHNLAWELFAASAGLDENRNFIPNIERYTALETKLDELLGHSDYFFENLMVTVAFYLVFPNLQSAEALWKSYVNLCNLYSYYRFAAVCSCNMDVSRERLFHVLVCTSRNLIHGKERRERLRDELFQNDSASLAHMAILVGG